MASDIICNSDFDWPEDLLPTLHSLRLPNTPMHVAADKGDCRRVSKLAGCGILVNCQNNLGDTPLHWSVRSARLNTSALLIELGADMYMRNDVGVSAEDDIQCYFDRLQQDCIRHKVAQRDQKCTVQSAADVPRDIRPRSPVEDLTGRKKARLGLSSFTETEPHSSLLHAAAPAKQDNLTYAAAFVLSVSGGGAAAVQETEIQLTAERCV